MNYFKESDSNSYFLKTGFHNIGTTKNTCSPFQLNIRISVQLVASNLNWNHRK